MAYSRIKPRRGTLYEWSTVNPVLDEGELGVIYPDSGVGTGLCKFKIGDGVHKFTEIPYAFDGAAAAAIDGGTVENFHLIQLRSGTEEDWMLINPILQENEIVFDTTNQGFKVGNGIDTWEDIPYTQSSDTIGGVTDYGDEDRTDVLDVLAASTPQIVKDDNSEGLSTILDIVAEETETIETESEEDDSEDPMQPKEDVTTD